MFEIAAFLEFSNSLGIVLAMVCSLTTTLLFLHKKFFRGDRESTVRKSGESVVILYQIGRGPRAPSPSPFPLKLETFLRMAKIPYKNDHSARFSSKGKTPWIEYNGVVVEDSQLAIDYLTKELEVDMNAFLTTAERATARAFQKMTEENLYWSMCGVTFGKDLGPLKSVLPYTGLKLWLVTKLLQRTIRQEMWGHGIGRHSPEDIWAIGKADLTALGNFLGEKKFFMGNEPCEVDCSIFGMVAQIVWHMPGSPHEALVKESLPNLVTYCERMRDTFWPDWESCVTTGKDFKGNN